MLSSPADAGEDEGGGLNDWNFLNELNTRIEYSPMPARGEVYCSVVLWREKFPLRSGGRLHEIFDIRNNVFEPEKLNGIPR